MRIGPHTLPNALMVAPMALLFRYSLNQYSPTELMIEAFTGANYLAAVTDPYYLEVMGRTLRTAAKRLR